MSDYLDELYEKEGAYSNIVSSYEDIIDELKALNEDCEEEKLTKIFYQDKLEEIREEIDEIEAEESKAELRERYGEYYASQL